MCGYSDGKAPFEAVGLDVARRGDSLQNAGMRVSAEPFRRGIPLLVLVLAGTLGPIQPGVAQPAPVQPQALENQVLKADCSQQRVLACLRGFPANLAVLTTKPEDNFVLVTRPERGEFGGTIAEVSAKCPSRADGFIIVRRGTASIQHRDRAYGAGCFSVGGAPAADGNNCPPGFNRSIYDGVVHCALQPNTDRAFRIGDGLRVPSDCALLAVAGPEIDKCWVTAYTKSALDEAIREVRQALNKELADLHLCASNEATEARRAACARLDAAGRKP